MTDTVQDPEQGQDPEPQAKAPRPRWFLPVIIGAAVLVVAAIVVSITIAVGTLAPKTFTAKGGVVVSGNTCDSMSSGYDDITKGAGVAVKDPAGKTVALGELSEGHNVDAGCAFLFTIKDVPSGLGIYGVEVTHRGVVQYKEATLEKNGAVLGLGN
jgi:hypothetical protein